MKFLFCEDIEQLITSYLHDPLEPVMSQLVQSNMHGTKWLRRFFGDGVYGFLLPYRRRPGIKFIILKLGCDTPISFYFGGGMGLSYIGVMSTTNYRM